MSNKEVVLGWGLGIISGPVISYLSNLYNSRKIETGIKTEFIDIRYRMGISLLSLSRITENFNVEFLNWMKLELESYERYYPQSPDLIQMKAMVRDLLGNQEYYDLFLASASETYNIPSFNSHYLDQKLGELAHVSEKKQQYILAAKRHLDVFNTKVEDLKNWDRMSFETTTPENFLRLQNNSIVSLKAIFQAGKSAIGEMNKFIIEFENL